MESEYQKNRILNFRVTEKTKQQLEKVARRYGVSKSVILSQSLREFLKQVK